MAKLDGKMAMAVLPASRNVTFSKLKKSAKAEDADVVVTVKGIDGKHPFAST